MNESHEQELDRYRERLTRRSDRRARVRGGGRRKMDPIAPKIISSDVLIMGAVLAVISFMFAAFIGD